MREQQLKGMTIKELRVEAKAAGVKNYANFKKAEYIQAILDSEVQPEEKVEELSLTLDLDSLPESKATPKKKEAKNTQVVTPADLAEEFGFRPQKVRRIIRNAGITFKERRITWQEGSRELEAVRELLSNFTQNKEA